MERTAATWLISGRSIEGRRHLYLLGERHGVFNPQGARNTDDVIITETVIDAAALWSAGLRNVIPVYGVTGLTEEIITHLVECRRLRSALCVLAVMAHQRTRGRAHLGRHEWHQRLRK